MPRPSRFQRVLLSCVPALLMLVGCERLEGSGTPSAQTRAFEDVHSLLVSGGAHVRITVDPNLDATHVHLFGDDNLLDAVETRVEGGTLTIARDASLKTTVPLSILITTSALDGLELSGSGRIDASGDFGAELEITLAGSGTIVAHGTVEALSLVRNGSGTVVAGALSAQDVTISSRGSGHAEVCAAQALMGERGGSGDVVVRCDPASVAVTDLGSDSSESGELVLIP